MDPDSRHHELARVETPRGELVLRERRCPGEPPVLELRAGGAFVMDTAEVDSERYLAEATLELVDEPHTVVVGGLGLGFTLQRVLEDPRVRTCTVVEIESALLAWMSNGTIPHGPQLLGDERVRTLTADIAAAVTGAPTGSCDVVLLDADNGPDQLVHPANAALYSTPFLYEVRATLRPGGALGVWSATNSTMLESRLREVFDDVEQRRVPVELQRRGESYWIYLARR